MCTPCKHLGLQQVLGHAPPCPLCPLVADQKIKLAPLLTHRIKTLPVVHQKKPYDFRNDLKLRRNLNRLMVSHRCFQVHLDWPHYQRSKVPCVFRKRLKYAVLSAVNANIVMILAVDQLKGMSHTDVHNISIGRYCLAIPQARCLKLYVWMVRTVTFLATPSYCAETKCSCHGGIPRPTAAMVPRWPAPCDGYFLWFSNPSRPIN